MRGAHGGHGAALPVNTVKLSAPNLLPLVNTESDNPYAIILDQASLMKEFIREKQRHTNPALRKPKLRPLTAGSRRRRTPGSWGPEFHQAAPRQRRTATSSRSGNNGAPGNHGDYQQGLEVVAGHR